MSPERDARLRTRARTGTVRVVTLPYGGGFVALPPFTRKRAVAVGGDQEAQGTGVIPRVWAARRQRHGGSMSGNGYQGKNSIPHLTVRNLGLAWAAERLHPWINPSCQCQQRGD